MSDSLSQMNPFNNSKSTSNDKKIRQIISPHLKTYKSQPGSTSSILHRLTGSILLIGTASFLFPNVYVLATLVASYFFAIIYLLYYFIFKLIFFYLVFPIVIPFVKAYLIYYLWTDCPAFYNQFNTIWDVYPVFIQYIWEGTSFLQKNYKLALDTFDPNEPPLSFYLSEAYDVFSEIARNGGLVSECYIDYVKENPNLEIIDNITDPVLGLWDRFLKTMFLATSHTISNLLTSLLKLFK